ncbi:TPA: plasmid mobilization relaxosome protein MobC, partial [Enterococcus faecium]|nr:plasmid mobilization relaxosome protein MobC [Enterococcus faecium]
TNISRTSSNINQIAKIVNSTSLIYKNDIDDLKKSLEKQAKDILSMRKKIYSLTYSNNFNTEKK